MAFSVGQSRSGLQRQADERARRQAEIELERAKIKALDHAATHWEKAEKLRSFVAAARQAAVQNGVPTEAGTPFGSWLVWAGLQADRIDPLQDVPATILEPDDGEPEYRYSYGFRAPEPALRFPRPIWRLN